MKGYEETEQAYKNGYVAGMENEQSITVKIIQKMRETEDAFIVKTIIPFVENELQVKVNKRELLEAIDKQIPKKPKRDNKRFVCPNCNGYLVNAYGVDYCMRCGQAIDWAE